MKLYSDNENAAESVLVRPAAMCISDIKKPAHKTVSGHNFNYTNFTTKTVTCQVFFEIFNSA